MSPPAPWVSANAIAESSLGSSMRAGSPPMVRPGTEGSNRWSGCSTSRVLSAYGIGDRPALRAGTPLTESQTPLPHRIDADIAHRRQTFPSSGSRLEESLESRDTAFAPLVRKARAKDGRNAVQLRTG